MSTSSLIDADKHMDSIKTEEMVKVLTWKWRAKQTESPIYEKFLPYIGDTFRPTPPNNIPHLGPIRFNEYLSTALSEDLWRSLMGKLHPKYLCISKVKDGLPQYKTVSDKPMSLMIYIDEENRIVDISWEGFYV